MPVARQSLRVQVRDEIRSLLRDGKLRAGEEISEQKLAEELGVSRTPLREALIALEAEGYIESQVGRGFRFALTTQQDFLGSAPIIAVLECLALDLTPPEVLQEVGQKLLRMADDFTQTIANHRELIRRDEEWHLLLTGGCGNEQLLTMLDRLKTSFHMLEYAILPFDAMVERSASDHHDIAEALIAGDLERAKTRLRENWTSWPGHVSAKGASTRQVNSA